MIVVTEESFPHGVRCHNCRREILPGEQYRNREVAPGVDGVFCVTCGGPNTLGWMIGIIVVCILGVMLLAMFLAWGAPDIT